MVRLRLLFTQGPKARQRLLSGGGVAVLAAILVLVNLLSRTLFARWDWTGDNRYSLSASSVKLVRSLPDPVLIRFYLTRGLPQPYQAHGGYVSDLLNEYRTASKGKVRIEIMDPDESDKARAEANGAGVVPARFTQVASDQFQVREGFIGLTLFYQDKQTVIPFVKDTNSLEYDISSRIKQMTSPEKKVLGFVTGHGEATGQSFREGFASGLFDHFEVSTVELSTSNTVTPDILFILGPRSSFSEAEIAILDDYLHKSVPTAIFLNRRIVNLGSFSTLAQVTGLEPFLEHYGVRVERDFVLDAQCQRISMQAQQGPYAVTNILNYPAIPLVDRLNKENLVTKSLDVVTFPFAHGLTPLTTAQAGLRVTTLASSSKYSWMKPNLHFLDPYNIPPPDDSDPKGPFPLAVLIEGSTSTFSKPSRTVASLRMVVVGSSYVLDPQMPLSDGNSQFVLNLAEWLAQDANMLAIPPKGSSFRPIRQFGPITRSVMKFLGFFFLPAAVLVSAWWRWRRRKELRLKVEQEFQKAVM